MMSTHHHIKCCTPWEFRRCLESFGAVSGTYVAKKRDKGGCRFSFATFKDVRDKEELEKVLRGVRMGDFKLKVNVVRFAMENAGVEGVPVGGARGPQTTFNLETLVDFDKLLRIAKVGFKNIQYLGGLSILVSFGDSEGAKSFLGSRKVWDPWFSKLESWEGHALPLERVVWLKISGVSLHLLNPEVLDMVGGVFGKVLNVKESFLKEKDLSVTTVAVLAGEATRVREMIKVVWKDRSFRVWVEEEPEDWIPDCLRFDEVSKSGILSLNSVDPVTDTAVSSPLASSLVAVCSEMGSQEGGEGVT
ncbi:putative RNA-binding domain superfamily [Helianthus anomalus]